MRRFSEMGPSNHRARFGSAVTSQHDTTLQVADGLPINVPVFGNPHGRIVAVSRIGPLWPAGDTGESRAFMTMWLVVAATESRDCGRSLQQARPPTGPCSENVPFRDKSDPRDLVECAESSALKKRFGCDMRYTYRHRAAQLRARRLRGNESCPRVNLAGVFSRRPPSEARRYSPLLPHRLRSRRAEAPLRTLNK
jgi:hypothetical protein